MSPSRQRREEVASQTDPRHAVHPSRSTRGRRTLHPRATAGISVAPLLVTDRTSAVVAGLEPRQFRALVVQLGVPHTVVGRRIVVRASDLSDAIGRASEEPGHIGGADEDGTREPTRSEILARIAGRRR